MKIITKHKKGEVIFPIEVGKTYETKQLKGTMFTVDKIDTDKHGTITKFWGRYIAHLNLGNCPINPERLIPETNLTGDTIEINLCPHCKEEIEL